MKTKRKLTKMLNICPSKLIFLVYFSMVFNVDSCLSHRKYMKNKKRLSSDFYVAGQNRKRTFSVLDDDATCVSKYVYVYIYICLCAHIFPLLFVLLMLFFIFLVGHKLCLLFLVSTILESNSFLFF